MASSLESAASIFESVYMEIFVSVHWFGITDAGRYLDSRSWDGYASQYGDIQNYKDTLLILGTVSIY